MKTRRWLSHLTVAMFVLVMVPLFSHAQAPDRPGRWEEFLDLTAEQKAKLEEFRKSGAEERRAHFEKMRKLREDMRAAMKDPEANEAKINGLIDEISKLRADRMKRGLVRAREMREIFTPEQREKLAGMRDRMTDRRAARTFRGRRAWDRPAWRREPFPDFGWRHPRMGRRPWRW